MCRVCYFCNCLLGLSLVLKGLHTSQLFFQVVPNPEKTGEFFEDFESAPNEVKSGEVDP